MVAIFSKKNLSTLRKVSWKFHEDQTWIGHENWEFKIQDDRHGSKMAAKMAANRYKSN